MMFRSANAKNFRCDGDDKNRVRLSFRIDGKTGRLHVEGKTVAYNS
jgi:hypothetical protein